MKHNTYVIYWKVWHVSIFAGFMCMYNLLSIVKYETVERDGFQSWKAYMNVFIVVLNSLTEKSELQQFWLRCIDSCLLITSSENFLKQLYHLESDVMTEYMVSPKRGTFYHWHLILLIENKE